MRSIKILFHKIFVLAVVNAMLMPTVGFSQQYSNQSNNSPKRGSSGFIMDVANQGTRIFQGLAEDNGSLYGQGKTLISPGPACRPSQLTQDPNSAFPNCLHPPVEMAQNLNSCEAHPGIEGDPKQGILPDTEVVLQTEKASLAGSQCAFFRSKEFSFAYDRESPAVMGEPTRRGANCIEDESKLLGQKLDQDIDKLKKIIEGVKDVNSKFEKANKENIKELERFASLLDGSNRKKEHKKYLDQVYNQLAANPACGDVIPNRTLKSARPGLYSIRDSGIPQRDAADKAAGNLQTWRNTYDKFKGDISQFGVAKALTAPGAMAGFFNNASSIGGSLKAQFNFALTKDIADFDNLARQVKQGKLDISPPVLSGDANNFDSNYIDSINNALARKEINMGGDIMECVRGHVTAEKLASYFPQATRNSRTIASQGNSRKQFLRQLQIALEESAHPANLMNDVKSTQHTYQANKYKIKVPGGVKYKNEDGKIVYQSSMSAPKFFETIVGQCNRQIKNPLNVDKSGRTQAGNKARAYQALEKMKAKLDTMGTRIVSEMDDNYLQCKSKPLQAQGTCQSASTYSPSSGDFCLANATQCVNNVKTCENVLQNVINNAENARTAVAGRYNHNLNAHVKAGITPLLMSINERMAAADSYLTQHFKDPRSSLAHVKDGVQGTGVLAINPDLLVPRYDATLGVDVIDYRAIANDMESKLLQQVAIMKQQKKNIMNLAKEEVARKRGIYREQYKRWIEIANGCHHLYKKAIASANVLKNAAVSQSNAAKRSEGFACDVIANPHPITENETEELMQSVSMIGQANGGPLGQLAMQKAILSSEIFDEGEGKDSDVASPGEYFCASRGGSDDAHGALQAKLKDEETHKMIKQYIEQNTGKTVSTRAIESALTEKSDTQFEKLVKNAKGDENLIAYLYSARGVYKNNPCSSSSKELSPNERSILTAHKMKFQKAVENGQVDLNGANTLYESNYKEFGEMNYENMKAALTNLEEKLGSSTNTDKRQLDMMLATERVLFAQVKLNNVGEVAKSYCYGSNTGQRIGQDQLDYMNFDDPMMRLPASVIQ